MAEPPLIPLECPFGRDRDLRRQCFSWRLGRASAEVMREERAALGGGVAKLSALNPNHPW
jgi:hypothetical protein